MKIRAPASASATTVTMPIFSSDQASDRVRGMTASFSRQKRFEVRVDSRGRAQLRGVPFERDAPFLQHDELGFLALLGVRRDDANPAVLPNRFPRGYPEGVAHLVRHDDRADVLEVAQLDDL